MTMMDMGSLICSYDEYVAELTQEKKRGILFQIAGCVGTLLFLFMLELYTLCVIYIVLYVVIIFWSQYSRLGKDRPKGKLEIWTNGYLLKDKSGQVYRVSYDQATMPMKFKFGDSFRVKIWDAEAVRHIHFFEVETVEIAQEICEKIEEAAQNAGVTLPEATQQQNAMQAAGSEQSQKNAIAMMIVGGIMDVIAYITYSRDTDYSLTGALSGRTYYSYTSPLTAHELMVVLLGIVGAVVLVAGIVKFVKRKG
jgi:Ca2+/Na+ antiporter